MGVAKCKLSGITRDYAWRDFKMKDITEYKNFKMQMTKRFARVPYTIRFAIISHMHIQQQGEDVQTFTIRVQSLVAETLIEVASVSEQDRFIVEKCQKCKMDERLRV